MSGTGLPRVGSQVDRGLMVVSIKHEFGVASFEKARQMRCIFKSRVAAYRDWPTADDE